MKIINWNHKNGATPCTNPKKFIEQRRQTEKHAHAGNNTIL